MIVLGAGLCHTINSKFFVYEQHLYSNQLKLNPVISLLDNEIAMVMYGWRREFSENIWLAVMQENYNLDKVKVLD